MFPTSQMDLIPNVPNLQFSRQYHTTEVPYMSSVLAEGRSTSELEELLEVQPWLILHPL